MTGNWKKCLAGIFIVMTIILIPSNASAAPQKVVVIYEKEAKVEDTYNVVTFLMEYLSHFEVEIKKLHVSEYRPGVLRQFDIVFYMGLDGIKLSPELLKEISRSKTVVWFEQDIQQLAGIKGWDDFFREGYRKNFVRLLYKEKEARQRAGKKPVYMVPAYTEIFVTHPGKDASVAARVTNLKESVPFAWKRDNVWYFARAEFYGDISLIIADLFYEILGGHGSAPGQVLLRIEDVSPFTPPEKLRDIMDIVNSYGIPYAVALSPVGIKDGQRKDLSEVPELVAVLKKIQHGNGCVILHGYTHQNKYSPVSGEGFEFWNAGKDEPMPNPAQFARTRLEKALEECARAGIYPVAFEPPHYAMCSKSYKVLAEYFTLFSGQVQESDKTYKTSITFPYTIKSHRLYGMTVYPENLGYVEPGDVLAVSNILYKARKLQVVRGCTAGIFFHTFISTDKLARLIEGLEATGYRFVDLSTVPHRVKSNHVQITVDGEQRLIETDIELPGENQKQVNFLVSGMNVLVMGLLLVTIVLVYITRRNIQKRRRFYEEE